MILEEYTLIIAIVALVTSIWSLISARTHNKLSVKPYLTAKVNEEFSSENSKLNLSYVIKNSGHGSAIIKSYNLYYDGKTEVINNRDEFGRFLSELLENYNAELEEYHAPGAKYAVIMPAESFIILNASFITLDKKNQDKLIEAINLLDIVVEFESIYGKKERLDTRYIR